MLRQFAHQAVAVLGVAVSMGLPFAVAKPASAEKTNFHFVNRSSYDIARLYMSSSNDPNWYYIGRDIDSGTRLRIKFANPYGRPCSYDFKWVFPNGVAQEVREVNVCYYGSYQLFD